MGVNDIKRLVGGNGFYQFRVALGFQQKVVGVIQRWRSQSGGRLHPGITGCFLFLTTITPRGSFAFTLRRPPLRLVGSVVAHNRFILLLGHVGGEEGIDILEGDVG